MLVIYWQASALTALERSEVVDLISILATALHESDARDARKMFTAPQAPDARPELCSSVPVGTLPEDVLPFILHFLDPRSLSCVSCVRQLKKAGAQAANAIFLARFPRVPAPPLTATAWQSICIQEDANAAVSLWKSTGPVIAPTTLVFFGTPIDGADEATTHLYSNLAVVAYYLDSNISLLEENGNGIISTLAPGTEIKLQLLNDNAAKCGFLCRYSGLQTVLAAVGRVVFDTCRGDYGLHVIVARSLCVRALRVISKVVNSCDDLFVFGALVRSGVLVILAQTTQLWLTKPVSPSTERVDDSNATGVTSSTLDPANDGPTWALRILRRIMLQLTRRRCIPQEVGLRDNLQSSFAFAAVSSGIIEQVLTALLNFKSTHDQLDVSFLASYLEAVVILRRLPAIEAHLVQLLECSPDSAERLAQVFTDEVAPAINELTRCMGEGENASLSHPSLFSTAVRQTAVRQTSASSIDFYISWIDILTFTQSPMIRSKMCTVGLVSVLDGLVPSVAPTSHKIQRLVEKIEDLGFTFLAVPIWKRKRRHPAL